MNSILTFRFLIKIVILIIWSSCQCKSALKFLSPIFFIRRSVYTFSSINVLLKALNNILLESFKSKVHSLYIICTQQHDGRRNSDDIDEGSLLRAGHATDFFLISKIQKNLEVIYLVPVTSLNNDFFKSQNCFLSFDAEGKFWCTSWDWQEEKLNMKTNLFLKNRIEIPII